MICLGHSEAADSALPAENIQYYRPHPNTFAGFQPEGVDMSNFFVFLKNESGATAIEYASPSQSLLQFIPWELK